VKRLDFDLGGVFAFLLAAAMTALTAGLLVVEGLLHNPLGIGLFVAPCVAALAARRMRRSSLVRFAALAR
jgi:hypothetical protein